MLKIFPAIALMLLVLTGCAADGSANAASNGPHSECLVCKVNVDLACVDVPVSESTPRYMYNGKAYYFCSDECMTKFIAHPEKYANK